MHTSRILATLLMSISALPAQEKTKPATPKVIDPMARLVYYQLAVYLPAGNEKDPLALLDKLLATDAFAKFERVDSDKEKPTRPVVLPHWLKDADKSYRPPSMRSLRYYGRGLSRVQAEALQKVKQAITIDIAYPPAVARELQVVANRLLYELGKATQGYVWDETARLVFTPAAWKAQRIDTWQKGTTDVSRHITIHAYKNGEHIRAITLGMRKFGLPDVVVQEFSWGSNKALGNVMNGFCQMMFEGRKLRSGEPFAFDLQKIENENVRKRQLINLLEGATGKAQLTLKRAKPDQGDPDNHILEIRCSAYEGPDEFARQDAMITKLYGKKDEVDLIAHNKAIEAASKAAKAKLPALRAAFNKGLKPGEQILVKFPFVVPDKGHEYMWVDVTTWKGDTIKGLLRNEPQQIKTLKAGQKVTVSMAKVFDYIHRQPDGSETGNETGKLIQKMRR